MKSRFPGIGENRLLSIAIILGPHFKDMFFSSNIIRTTVKQMLEEEIQKTVPDKDNNF